MKRLQPTTLIVIVVIAGAFLYLDIFRVAPMWKVSEFAREDLKLRELSWNELTSLVFFLVPILVFEVLALAGAA